MPGSPDRPALTTVTVPDTELASAATQLVRDTTDDLIYHHSRRVYYFGGLQGRNGGLGFDPELLYVAAMFHDLGLNEEYRASGRRFEVDSADEARRFLRSHGVPEDGIRRVWTAIALHTTPGIPSFMEPEVALLTAACGVRRTGHRVRRHQRRGPGGDRRPPPPPRLQAPHPQGLHRGYRTWGLPPLSAM